MDVGVSGLRGSSPVLCVVLSHVPCSIEKSKQLSELREAPVPLAATGLVISLFSAPGDHHLCLVYTRVLYAPASYFFACATRLLCHF